MSIAEKLTTIAENEQRVYNAGFEAGKSQGGDSDFWDIVLQKGKRNDLRCAFYMWDIDYIRPPYKLTPTDQFSGYMTFSSCENLKKVEKAYFDFSEKATGTNTNASWQYTFSGCYNLKVIEDIGLTPQYSYLYTFRNCQQLETIEKLGCDANTGFSSPFTNCYALKNITIDGTIGKNGFNISAATKLSRNSILSILSACNKANAGITVTLPSKCIDGTIGTSELLSGGTDAELTAAWDTAKNNGYTIAYA